MRTNARALGILTDVLTCILAFVIVYYLCWFIRGHPIFPRGTCLYFETIMLVSWFVSLVFTAEYPIRRITAYRDELKIVLRVNVISVLLFAFAMFALKVHGMSRLFVILDFAVTVVGMSINRIIIRLVLSELRKSGWDLRTRIIVGTRELAERYILAVEDAPGTGIRVLGFVGVDGNRHGPSAPYLGDVSSFREIIARISVDGVIVALPLSHPETRRVVQECQEQGIAVELMLDEFTSLLDKGGLVYSMNVPRLYVPGIPHSSVAIIWKRATDVVVSAIALALLSPLFVLVAIAIKLDDRGPVLFSQQRVGLRGRMFRMYKFRSMVIDAEKRKQELLELNEMSGPVFKLKNDPRITRVGRFLRKTSLDELPQLWNVLKGEMSLVGPRPPLPDEVDRYDYAHRKRLSVKPGLTCLWQISGRNNVDFDEWMHLDMDYIDNWSYVNDLKILIRTIPAVLRKDGAS
ncbi:Undecaprenyl-phosphate galactose phosphotransferase, WbaP/exopolysaccharide biosynthesis polyprenyl glycosylphosphotransferase [Alicyclobacillus hesperidum]|uniref:Undecaprenyl-phosphate galactose phosphotransferase, WbaP/exopolysaccharide biosynthesis polyprenyl glycosylphosphotransferase n=1 Tax=Alicyclobacillus hesperidum TaxID=89784 RepID=A0A1H2WJG7_9BACL|nr:sugar transferase [Alicyclobacillus hesperidum]SDW80626.1 Undecaprenyl-phosphate galactose phosphotransferase, WbaP/exopolysaccharide biosynthesis polyprenyl glycosylphosphotransferase [Alicyclobacillus hesperidum]